VIWVCTQAQVLVDIAPVEQLVCGNVGEISKRRLLFLLFEVR
jgi:hypothetical protein